MVLNNLHLTTIFSLISRHELVEILAVVDDRVKDAFAVVYIIKIEPYIEENAQTCDCTVVHH